MLPSQDFFICPICDGKSFKYEGWFIKHMENKHPGCAFGVVAKGREDDKSDQEKRGKIMLLLIEILFCVAKNRA